MCNRASISDISLFLTKAKNLIVAGDFDRNQIGDIWEFKKSVDGEQFYVKLKIQNQNGKDVLKCISFHEDDF